EDDGGFFTVGYELGQVMQDVKNPGKSQADTLTNEMNATYTNNVSANQGANIVGVLSNTFTQYLYSLLGAYSAQQILSNVGGLNNTSDPKFINNILGSGTTPGTIPYQINQTSTGNNQYNTSYEHVFQELSYLSSVEYFLQAMNNVLSTPNSSYHGAPNNSPDSPSSVFYTKYVDFLKAQNQDLYNAANTLMGAILALGDYSTANNTQELTNQQIAQNANQVISASEKTLETLSDNAQKLVSGSSAANGLAGVTSVIQARSASLQTTMLPNAENTLNKLIGLVQKVESTPYLPQFRAGNSRQTNIMNGFYTKWGYKQFFGKKRNIGLRYYGFFSYNGASVGFRETSNSVGLYTYGVGTDVLYNIFERSYQNKSVNMGVFGGIQLAGETFNSSLKNSQYVNKKDIQSTHFQFLFDLGFRMNFGKLGQKTKRHRQHTVEIGVQVPTIYNTYYKSAGTTVRYFRPYSVYWSYGYSF
uniref:outer membrane protein n=1 Tax=Helicobacter cetorum TaxID=138563 RepID=UPI000CF1A7CD